MVLAFPAIKGDDGEWRFLIVRTGLDGHGWMSFGTEQDEDGMTEARLREVLATSGQSPTEIDEIVKTSIAMAEV